MASWGDRYPVCPRGELGDGREVVSKACSQDCKGGYEATGSRDGGARGVGYRTQGEDVLEVLIISNPATTHPSPRRPVQLVRGGWVAIEAARRREALRFSRNVGQSRLGGRGWEATVQDTLLEREIDGEMEPPGGADEAPEARPTP